MGNLFEHLIKHIVEWVDKIIKLYWNIFMIFLKSSKLFNYKSSESPMYKTKVHFL